MTSHDEAMREIRLRLARRVVEHLKHDTTDLAPDVMHDDVAFYRDPARYEREMQKLFRETPLVAGLSQELPTPGSYLLFEDAGVPIVVWRGQDRQVRAFLNICAHRGARLCREASGRANRLSCRFHGWTYDSTGKLIGVPEEEHFLGQLERNRSLVALPAEERHGVVFVQAEPGSSMDLDAHLGAFEPELAALDLGAATRVFEEDFHVTCNWKYALDTYFENYHVAALHRETFAPNFLHKVRLFDAWGGHHRLTFPHRSVYEWIDKPEDEWPIDTLPIAYFLFPNTVIPLGTVATANGSYFSINQIFPVSVGEMKTRYGIYAPRGVQSPEHLADLTRAFEASKRVLSEEDYAMAGDSYPAFHALPAGTTFPIGRNEVGVQNFHHNIRLAVGD
jgi:phenylpropionate dioxygenase-like ring-hydroxylating dioxygenase large terminal subunit